MKCIKTILVLILLLVLVGCAGLRNIRDRVGEGIKSDPIKYKLKFILDAPGVDAGGVCAAMVNGGLYGISWTSSPVQHMVEKDTQLITSKACKTLKLGTIYKAVSLASSNNIYSLIKVKEDFSLGE